MQWGATPSGSPQIYKQTLPIAYINKFRISVAEEMLKKTDDTITEIASSVGIHDPIYFNKLFHRAYQVSPREYRKRYKQSI